MGDEPDFWRMKSSARRAQLLAKRKSSHRAREVTVLSAGSRASGPTQSRASQNKKSQASYSYYTDSDAPNANITISRPSKSMKKRSSKPSYSYYSSDAPPPVPASNATTSRSFSSTPPKKASYSYYSTEESGFKVSAAPRSDSSSYQKNLSLSYMHPSEESRQNSYGYDQYKYTEGSLSTISNTSSHSTKKYSSESSKQKGRV